MITFLRSVFTLIRKDFLIVTPPTVFYLLLFMYLQSQDLTAIREDQQFLLMLGGISMLITVFLQLFVSYAAKQLLHKKKVNFSEAIVSTLKSYPAGLLLFSVFIIPLDLLGIVVGHSSVIGTILLLTRLFLHFVIAPAVVLNSTLKAMVLDILGLFRFRRFFELAGLISLSIMWFIILVLILGLLKAEAILPLVIGFFMTYINMMVFYFMFQSRGKVC